MILLCLKKQLGHYYWLTPLVVMIWPTGLALLALFDITPVSVNHSSVQNWLIGFPLNLLAIGIGIGIIADEIEKQTLEVTYTIPGGTRRIWLYSILACLLILVAATILLSLSCYLFISGLPSGGEFFRGFQGAVFFLIWAMALGCFFRSKLVASLLSLLTYAGLIFVNFDTRWSPLFNPASVASNAGEEVHIWMIQNHVGVTVLLGLLLVLSFARVDRVELMLKD